MQFPKHGMSELPYSIGEVWGKKQTLQNYGLLNISCEAKVHTIPKPPNSHIMEQ